MKRYLLIALISFGFVSVPYLGLADTLYQQPNNGTSYAITNPSPANHSFYQSLGTGLVGSVSSLTMYVSGSTSLSRGPTIYRCDNTNISSCTNQATYSGSSVTLTSSPQLQTFTFTPFTLDPAKYYYIVLTGPGGGTNMQLYGNSDGTFYANGVAGDWDGSTVAASGSVADFYFVLAGSFSDSIAITYPVSGSTNLPNFGLWGVQYGVAQNQPSTWINVFVNTTSTVSASNYLWFDQEIKNGTAGFYTDFLNRLPQTLGGGYVSSTTYYAQAVLYSATSTLATSAVINFQIGNTGADLVFAPPPSLLPGQGTGPVSSYCLKAPFAYWCDLVAIYNTLTPTSTTSTIPTLSISIPDVHGAAGNTSTTISIISAANINNTLGASNVALLRQILQYGLWGTFVIYLIERIRYLQL